MLNRIIILLLSMAVVSCSKEIFQQKLSVDWTPLNGGTVSPPTNAFEKGTVVSMIATPAGEYTFKQWSGSLSGNTNPSPITLDADKQVTGVFEKRKYPLTLSIVGSGSVKEDVLAVAPQTQYPSGTTVRLSPQPADKFEFAGWSGDLTSSANPLDLKIDRAINLKALFQQVKAPTVTPAIEMEIVDSRLKSTKTGKIDVPVVIINFLPDTIISNQTYLNPKWTLESSQPWDAPFQYKIDRAKSKILAERIIEKNAIEEGTRFRDYGANKAEKYINIDVVAYINVKNIKLTGKNVDFNDLFARINLKDYVEKLGAKEVWFTFFLKSDLFDVPESNMSPRVGAPYGDISNSYRELNDLPRYNKTYVVYGNNGWRGVDTDLHNRGHQLEMEMMHIDGLNRIWLDKFAKVGRGGNTHFAPNSLKDYDWANTAFVKSDIETWKPSGGTFVDVNVNTWVSKRYPFEKNISMTAPSRFATGQNDFTNDAPTKWFIYWWQSVPGMNNGITDVQGTGSTAKKITLSNWWDLFFNFDEAVNLKKQLVN
ncbi:hypothetical protein [Aquirufa sp.]|jgi:hypothetical protein|uniref:InlB B-repeat-containing protein n=1 Tax=Aquirufa sp. TaxID=2676249 RepID=UPI0037BF78E8